MIARALACALALLALGPLATPTPAGAAAAPPKPSARAWVLVDAEDGSVLAAHRASTSYSIASTTKLMTAYVARRALRLDEEVVAPPYNALPAESLLGLEAGERMTVRDLLYGMLLVSGNDAAVALATAAAGSVPAFVVRMNRTAKRLGLDDSAYANPIGLDEAGNYSSAKDLTRLAILMRRDRLFQRIFDTPETVLSSGAHPRDVVNRNALLFSVPWVNGVKTGYTLDAGNVLVGSGERKGVELVSAVLGAPSESERDAATVDLLDYGFSLYHRRSPVRKGEALASAELRWQDQQLPLEATREVRLTVRRGDEVSTRVDAPSEVEGPIDRGEPLGEATVLVDSERVARVRLAAARSAPPATVLERYDAAVPGPRALAWLIAVGVIALVLVVAVALVRGRHRSG
ncbi:MAG TPA: D-alanyl-D-alanine carboxypeptidase family protein [Solirubrobacterales bacterium]|nr:D-alanyl-D-alanine carboxypeptidase family protein [Solirubrobacterales bacterium]